MVNWGTGLLVVALTALPIAAVPNDHYTPSRPSTATLAGSTVVMPCTAERPEFVYRVRLVEGDTPSEPVANAAAAVAAAGVDAGAVGAVLVLSDGERSISVPLGAIGDGLDGVLPWPDDVVAFVDGVPEGRSISATLQTDPAITPALAVPFDDPSCSAVGALRVDLAGTGGDAAVGLAAAAGAGLVLVGGALSIRRVRRRAEGRRG